MGALVISGLVHFVAAKGCDEKLKVRFEEGISV